MVISVFNRARSMVIGYRVFAQRKVILDGMVYKRHVDFRDIQDVIATVSLDGVKVRELDAVGIVLPGVINRMSVSLPTDDIRDYDLGRKLEKKYGIEVYVDNNANAAAMGAYMGQLDYDSVGFYIHRTGITEPGIGLVVDGHLVKGRNNYAGEISPLAKVLKLSGRMKEMAWTYEGMNEIVAKFLATSVCNAAPDAIFVNCHLTSDMDALHDEMAKLIPEQYLPDLFWIDDQRELIYLGELALCIDKLENPRPHRKW